MYETIRVEREGHLTWLVLDRPESLNAMNDRLISEVSDFFRGLSDDHETRVVAMRGEGRAFCAGLDLKAHASEPAANAGNASIAGGLRLTKECLKHSIDAGSLEQAIAMEDRNQILAAQSADFREGVRAFLEKREARFRDA